MYLRYYLKENFDDIIILLIIDVPYVHNKIYNSCSRLIICH